MRKAFTLVELLIVVLVFVILMSIVFRLSSIGGDSEARSQTIMKLQKLENCLSGYYAAFGSYPPVKLHGSRNYRLKTNEYGIQQVNEQADNGDLVWKRVDAACRSQPLAMNYPYSKSMKEYVKSVSEALKMLHHEFPDSRVGRNAALALGFDALENVNQLSSKTEEASWSETQLFRFGLMSFLLPRYLIMMEHEDRQMYDQFMQWSNNNELPCRFEDGIQYETWEDMATDISRRDERWKIQLIPSQAVTARWMPNLQGLLRCDSPSVTIFGVNVTGRGSANLQVSQNANPVIFSAADSQRGESAGLSQQYALDGITCDDGWGNEFYYYSRPPYQSYRLWSAGPNGYTFPPWASQDEISKLSSSDQKKVANWIADDIVQMSN